MEEIKNEEKVTKKIGNFFITTLYSYFIKFTNLYTYYIIKYSAVYKSQFMVCVSYL